jgi:hypothetical protein
MSEKDKLNVERGKSGAISIVGQESVSIFRLTVMLRGLMIEVKTGMQMTRGPSCYTLAKREFGLKGSKEKVLEQLTKIVNDKLDEVGATQEERMALCDAGSVTGA